MLVVSDITGKQMLSKIIDANENTQAVETNYLMPGVYRVQLRDGESLLKSLPLVIIK